MARFPRHYVISRALLFAALALIAWKEVRGESLIGLGPAQVGGEISGGMLTLTERRGRYDFTLGYITEQEFSRCARPSCEWLVEEQIFVGVERLFVLPWTDKLNVSVGPYWFQNADRIGTANFRIGVSGEYRFNDHIGLRGRHFSTAGSGPELEICRPEFGCITNDWNTGQDSWLRLVVYF